jgi:hypothetical protein
MNVDVRAEAGVAVIVALLAMLLMIAIGAALVLTTSSETMIAANFRASTEAFYAADAAIERAMVELNGIADWNAVLTGSRRSAFVDGPPSGMRTLADGSTVDLTAIVNQANCGRVVACSAAEMDAVTIERPWGANNPRWQLFAYGPLTPSASPGTIDAAYYILVLVGDDSAENDGNPLQDGAGSSNSGSGVVVLRAEARGARGARKAIEATIARGNAPRLLTWRERR